MADQPQPTIYWLDNEPHVVAEAARALIGHGYSVRVFTDEAELVSALETGAVPDLLIQDLHRRSCIRQIRGGIPRTVAGELRTNAGWHFYTTVMKAYFPQVPVIVVSARGAALDNANMADDFNLTILDKRGTPLGQLLEAVRCSLGSQERLVDAVGSPATLLLDLERVNAQLLQHLHQRPADIHLLKWPTFEELIERLLLEMGYDVQRTRLTKDGGVDLWALKSTGLSVVQYAIDAKHYAPGRPIGVHHVRAIHSVVSHLHSSVGMIVTSSYASKGARDLASQLRYQVSLKDFRDIVGWISLVNDAPSLRALASR